MSSSSTSPGAGSERDAKRARLEQGPPASAGGAIETLSAIVAPDAPNRAPGAPEPGAPEVQLSPAEEVLAIPYLSKRSVMSFLTQAEALPLRTASRACRDAVAEHAWGKEDALSSLI